MDRLGSERHRPLQIRQCLFEPLQRDQRFANLDQRVDRVALHLQNDLETSKRVAETAFLPQQLSEFEAPVLVIGVAAQRFTEPGFGACRIAVLYFRLRPIVIVISGFGIDLIPPSGMSDSCWGFPSGPISDSMW